MTPHPVPVGHPASSLLGLAAGLVLAAAFPAWGQDSRSLSGTTVTIQPTARAGALAEIVLHNKPVNDGRDEIAFDLSLGDLTASIAFDWQANAAGDDAITVTPPEGVSCLPTACILIVPEGDAGTLWLFDVLGVGM